MSTEEILLLVGAAGVGYLLIVRANAQRLGDYIAGGGLPPGNNAAGGAGAPRTGAGLTSEQKLEGEAGRWAGAIAGGPVGVGGYIGGKIQRAFDATPIEDVPLAVRIRQVQASNSDTVKHFIGGQSVEGAPDSLSLNDLLASGGKTFKGVNYSAGLSQNGGAYVRRDHRKRSTG